MIPGNHRRQAVTVDHKIYLYLEQRVDFLDFREYQPKAIMKPLSGYKVARMVLKELYL